MIPLSTSEAALLVGSRLDVSAGLEVLDLALNVTSDISAEFVGGSVARNMDAKIHGTCRLALSTELAWGNVLLRPYMTVSDGTTSARWNRGVYMVTTPETVLGDTPVTYSAQGMDRIYLLDRQVGASYTVASGTTYRAALVQAFTDAGLSGYVIDGSAADYTLPTTRTWALVGDSTNPDQTTTPVTWLRVVNDLLDAVNFRAVWADENGLFRCGGYQSPAVRAPEFTFNADDATITIVGQNRTILADQWKTPNKWVFRWTNRPGGMSAVEGDGIYTYNLPAAHALSATNRGLTWTSVVDYEAASQAVLTSLGDRRVAADLRVAKQVKVMTGPFPVAGHYDVFSYVDTAAGGTLKVMAQSWEHDLVGGDVSWVWEVI